MVCGSIDNSTTRNSVAKSFGPLESNKDCKDPSIDNVL